MKKQKEALKYFDNKFNCSQAVLACFKNEIGLSEDDCLKIACAFGGGMGRKQYTCGAVTGALMVLGMKYGKALQDDDSKKNNTYVKTREFLDEFERLNSSTTCKVLLQNLDMNNAEDLSKINELNLFKFNCEKYITDAINILEKM